MECWAALSYCKRDLRRGPINPRAAKSIRKLKTNYLNSCFNKLRKNQTVKIKCHLLCNNVLVFSQERKKQRCESAYCSFFTERACLNHFIQTLSYQCLGSDYSIKIQGVIDRNSRIRPFFGGFLKSSDFDIQLKKTSEKNPDM